MLWIYRMTALVSCWARSVNQNKWPTLLHDREDVTSRYAKVCVTKIKCYMHKFKNWTFVIATLLTLLFASIDTLLTREHLHDRIMLIRGVDWTYKTDLTPSLFIEMFAPSQECERSCICVRHIDLTSVFTMCILGFGSVPTVWYFCVLRNLCNHNTHVSVEFASYSFCVPGLCSYDL